jgi:oxygen-dependent protoporphyrinogen oxidase
LQALSPERSGTDSTLPTVAVIGGGFAGLVAARDIGRRTRARVVVHEAGDAIGGKVLTTEVDGIRVEAGPDSFLPRDDLMLDLCKQLGIADELISPAIFGGLVWVKGRLERLPFPSLYGMPGTPRAALRSTALSMRGRLRAASEPAVPAVGVEPDISVADFVRRRFGREVLERLVDPLLAGTRAGDVNDMSFAAALGQVHGLAAKHGSVMKGIKAADAEPTTFYGLRSGMHTLIEALRRDIGDRVEFRLGDRIERIADRGDYYDLVSADGRVATADTVVITTPAYAAAGILQGLDEGLARAVDLEYASSASIALVYPPASIPVPAEASGILVPSSEETTISGCTYFTAKWPHLAPSDGRQLIRCFVGRAGRHPALELDDESLVSAAHRDLARITEAETEPIAGKVTRWERSLPQYQVGHPSKIATVGALLERHPRLALAGTGYEGSGLPDVARGSLKAAARAHKYLEPAY